MKLFQDKAVGSGRAFFRHHYSCRNSLQSQIGSHESISCTSLGTGYIHAKQCTIPCTGHSMGRDGRGGTTARRGRPAGSLLSPPRDPYLRWPPRASSLLLPHEVALRQCRHKPPTHRGVVTNFNHSNYIYLSFDKIQNTFLHILSLVPECSSQSNISCFRSPAPRSIQAHE